MNHSPKMLAVGGAHIDRRGQIAEAYVAGASNPHDARGHRRRSIHALRNAVRRGAAASLLSVRGGDGAGDAVARAIAQNGIADLSAVFLDRSTPSYTALLDRHGDVIAALADMSLYELAFPKQLRRAKVRDAVEVADAVLCDANLPAAALQRLIALAVGKPAFAIAISPAKAVRLVDILPSLACLFMNRREAAAIAGARQEEPVQKLVDRLQGLGLTAGVITHGAMEVVGFGDERIVSVIPPQPRRVADVTGAGDALAGAMSVALLHGLPFKEALREGMAAAMLAIECKTSVPEFSAADFAEALALVPEASELR